MRGKQDLRKADTLTRRITPACAGKTLLSTVNVSPSWDHPRVCGENGRTEAEAFIREGSPPRVRGKQCMKGGGAPDARITPACAGKTSRPPLRSQGPEDHPRVCGENSSARMDIMLYRGSPPRVRGKPCELGKKLQYLRITPACAGKTRRGFFRGDARWDHPRVCGENEGGWAAWQADQGSPPRVRGKLQKDFKLYVAGRITPACAGKTSFFGMSRQML